MGKRLITSVNPSEILLENILIEMNGHYFCKDTAAKIVGGTKRLERLIAAGEIEAEKRANAKMANGIAMRRKCLGTAVTKDLVKGVGNESSDNKSP